MPIINYIPFLLIVLLLAMTPMILYAKRAIVRGDWAGHRKRMLVALVMWLVSMLLLVTFLLRNGFSGLFADNNLLFVAYGAAAFLCSLMVALALLRVLKHQYLPHKMLARKTVYVWSVTSLLGAVLFGYSILITLSL